MKLRDKYDPKSYYSKASDCLSTVTREEAQAWFNHPCTKALIQTLEGDFAGLLLMWVGGGYSNEEFSDATAQLQAKARGQAQAIDDVIEHMHNLRRGILEDEEEEEDYETGN